MGSCWRLRTTSWCGGSQGKVSQNLFALRSLPRDWIRGERGPTATRGQLRQTAFTITSLTSIVVMLVMLLKPSHSPSWILAYNTTGRRSYYCTHFSDEPMTPGNPFPWNPPFWELPLAHRTLRVAPLRDGVGRLPIPGSEGPYQIFVGESSPR